MDINDVLNQFGDFWIVGEEKLKFTGKLIKDSENIVLECYIERSLIETDGEIIITPRTIHGIVDCKKITLISSYCIKSNGNQDSSKENSVFSPEEVIVGEHYCNDNINIKKITAQYTDLEYWFMFCTFKPKNNSSTILCKNPIQEISINDNLCNICFTFDFIRYYEIIKRFEISNMVLVSFDFHYPILLTDARHKVFSLNSLLTYFAGENLSCYNINFIDKADTECYYYLNFSYKAKRKRKMPFPIMYNDIQEKFQAIWTAWIKFSKTNEPINDLFFEVINNHSRCNNQFLNLMQALDVYSNRMRKEEAKVVYRKYKESDPDNEKQLALKHKIVDILRHTNEVFSLKFNEIDAFASKTANTRNYYTHYNCRIENLAFPINSLGDINRFLKAVLIAVVLVNIGVPTEAIKKGFNGKGFEDIKPFLI